MTMAFMIRNPRLGATSYGLFIPHGATAACKFTCAAAEYQDFPARLRGITQSGYAARAHFMRKLSIVARMSFSPPSNSSGEAMPIST
jgi:hypothetical protein